ncbi:MAG: Gfo/Idh/MocA family oxidoreductase [Chloroflexia bacterium]
MRSVPAIAYRLSPIARPTQHSALALSTPPPRCAHRPTPYDAPTAPPASGTCRERKANARCRKSPAHSLPIAVVGLGGYADTISRLLERESREPNPAVRLVGIYEPDIATHAARMDELRASGVAIADSYDALLAGPAEAIWLPIPIELHRDFTERALAAGKAVMCEKPVAGSIDDLAAMRAARDRANRPVAIGFQDLYDPATHAAKQRLVNGAIGELRSATLVACWPREQSYYDRNTWAGAFRRRDTWVMDSPLSNAISHYANLVLFWLGDTLHATAHPLTVEAELYRANPIENYDTAPSASTSPATSPP